MDFILELLFEIIIEGSFELGTHHKVPMPLRILALLIVVLVYGALIVLLFLAGYSAAKDGDTGVAGMLYVIDAFIVIACIFAVRKKFKENRR